MLRKLDCRRAAGAANAQSTLLRTVTRGGTAKTDKVVKAQQVSLKELRHKLEESKERCATHVRALDQAAARVAALEADNVQLQMETAQVGCAPSL